MEKDPATTLQANPGIIDRKLERQVTLTKTGENNENKPKKVKKRKVLKYYNVDRLGDLKVCEYFFWRGIWKKELLAYKADFLFHIFEDNIDWSWVKDKMVNKIPGVTVLSHKQQNAYVIKQFQRIHNEEMKAIGFPETFILPHQIRQYVEAHKSNKKHVYLTKQNTGSQGTGIVMLMNPSQLVDVSEDLIVQRYIHNPYLVRGLKHDMRIYVTLTSIEPMTAYINYDGLVRFCTEPYEAPTSENRIKGTVHLTNYSLNKNSTAYVFSDSLEETSDGSKQLLSVYLKSYPDPEGFWEKLTSLVQHTLAAMRPFLRYYLRCAYPKQDQGKMFHIIGFDVILDDEGELHLLELNANPSMNIQFEGNDEVKDKIKETVKDKDPAKEIKTVPKSKETKMAESKKEKPKPKLAFGSKTNSSSVPRKPTVIQEKKTDSSKEKIEEKPQKKPRVPKLSPQPSMLEVIEEDETPMKDLAAKYKKFRDYEFQRNDARKNPADIDPICFVDLHVKSR